MKTEFIKEYQLSDAAPIDPSLRSIPAEAFALALEEFMNDRFRGISRTKAENISAESILVSAEYVAYFFKMLLTYVYGRAFLDMNISCDSHNLIITISADGEIPLTDSERRFLIKTARNAGMEIYPEKNRIKLTSGFSKAAYRRVYAISVSDGRLVMLGKLNEIFFCGPPLILTKANTNN